MRFPGWLAGRRAMLQMSLVLSGTALEEEFPLPPPKQTRMAALRRGRGLTSPAIRSGLWLVLDSCPKF